MKKSLLLLSLFTFIFFSACNKEGLKKDSWDKKDKDDYDKEICFELEYPITYQMPDDSEIVVTSEENMWTEIKAWYEAHPDVEEKPALQYPVNIIYAKWDDGENVITTINDDEEMVEAKKECYDDKEACFKIAYPITFAMPDGSNIVTANEEDMWTQIKTWYEAHPDVEEKPTLQYPVDITYGDEENDEIKTVTVNNEEEMVKAKKACYDKKEACFKLIFPYAFNMPDGTSITADNEENLWTAVKDWYEAHPDVVAEPMLTYPVNVIINDDWDDDEVGETITINTHEEMMALKTDCYEKEDACFELVFPISFTMPDGSTISGGDEEALKTAIENWYAAHPDYEEADLNLNYPVDIEYEDGSTATIADEEAMILAKEDCFTDDGE